MTEQEKNVQIIKAMFSAYDRGDIKTVIDHLADHVDWKCPVANDFSVISWANPRHSPLEVHRFFNEFLEKVEPLSMRPMRFTAQDDRVIVEGTERSRIRSTGGEYSVDWVMVFVMENGKCTQVSDYLDTSAVIRAIQREVRKAA